jgi:hypothetical protein
MKKKPRKYTELGEIRPNLVKKGLEKNDVRLHNI